MEAVIVAALGCITGFFSWRANVHAKQTRKDVATNHGKRPGEYLEQSLEAISEVKAEVVNGQQFINARIDHLAGEVAKNGDRITALERV